MNRLVLALALGTITVAVACAQPSPTPPPTVAPSPTPPVAASPTPTVGLLPTSTATPTAGPTSTPEATVSPVSFFLEVLSPTDETVVRQASVEVKGRSVPDAVVSVNGQVASLAADGTFSATVPLQEGPNTIEVLASDFQGGRASRLLTVIYAAQ
ncbi:MAG: hypothetical protein HY683_00810 [Chloroflexi bacterium]|nr:hypothetical protein [Chloroflexota bacterium]